MTPIALQHDARTRTDLAHAGHDLTASLDAIVAATQGVQESTWTARESADAWSIADVLEHLAAVEDVFLEKIAPRLASAPPSSRPGLARDWDNQLRVWEPDLETRIVVPGRASLAEAPPPIRPRGARTGRESLALFTERRRLTLAYLASRTLDEHRAHAVDHLALGPLDGVQWLIFLATHTMRHLKQIQRLSARQLAASPVSARESRTPAADRR